MAFCRSHICCGFFASANRGLQRSGKNGSMFSRKIIFHFILHTKRSLYAQKIKTAVCFSGFEPAQKNVIIRRALVFYALHHRVDLLSCIKIYAEWVYRTDFAVSKKPICYNLPVIYKKCIHIIAGNIQGIILPMFNFLNGYALFLQQIQRQFTVLHFHEISTAESSSLFLSPKRMKQHNHHILLI